ncbi:P27 family phage terminase small subunit [Paenibacillus larvae]|uniref:Terminase small subunit n=5 Tax=root TaxID=1 RepID=A0A0K2CZ94_9CAUD|nr:P27 family phage terminase small subunit [Paenibacillus larvae]YP_009193814.1 terminase small subunit [Paenibacillus phage Harrison]ALA12567.1 terminase small subunit [Paenibacillus phage Paisley]ALA12737.1 terminase small subunit [Paenibacillus phage Hayley]UYE92026.1 terminase small subunit [Paenibacillus phage LunBun]UYE92108.1 terminase small subunit [Paenibacillus phage BarryFoster_Benicio]UYL91472.1 terminase small subunit [Paenibacillus phage ABAtENZ]UYL91554.1 terminase small subu
MAVPTSKLLREYLGEAYEESDEQLIQLYIETHQFYRRLQKEIKNSELMYEYTNKAGATNLVKNPLSIELTKTVQTLNNLLKSLGLTPAQRKKVAGDEDDDFDEF